MPALFAEHINYQVKGRAILRDVSFEAKRGERFALLGHNGSGKSSLIEIMTGVTARHSGKAGFADGADFSKIKRTTGVLWDNLNIFPFLKVREAIRHIAALYRLKPEAYREIYDCLEIENIQNQFMQKLSRREKKPKAYREIYDFLEIENIQNQFMQKLSRGEKKRTEILLATMHRPTLLILDEPAAELDPLVREKVWQHIFLKAETVFFTTHLWEEAKKFASSIAFIYKGALLNKPASYHELIASSGFAHKITVAKEAPLELSGAASYETEKEKIILVPQGSELIEQVRKATVNYSVMPVELEDIYRNLINK